MDFQTCGVLAVKLSEIQAYFPELIESRSGPDLDVSRVYSIKDCQPGDLVFVMNEEFAEAALNSRASAIVTTRDLATKFSQKENLGVLTSSNVKLAHALIKQLISDRDFDNEQWGDIHPSAVIHPSAQIGKDVHIAPNVTIGRNVSIGEGTRIQPGVVIEEGASLGEYCVIHSNAVIGYNCELGNHVDIGPGSVLGSEGYGFAQDARRKSHRIPQTGKVVIEDDVRIGANNCIDRATYDVTRIGAGTKTDNLCHFAHNVDIGKDCLITSMFCIAGSSTLGDRVIASGQTGVIDHINVCSDTVLLHRAGVTKDVSEPGAYAGLPLQPLKSYMKAMAQLKKMGDRR